MNFKSYYSNKNKQFKMLHSEPATLKKMSHKIISWLPDLPHEYVVICIGTDRSTGDSLGPLVGTFFSEMSPKHITNYGTLHEPVHATNLLEYIKTIHTKHHNPYIIAIDACLGSAANVGHLMAGVGSLVPGAALNKQLPAIGNIHLTGVVNISGFMEYTVLQSTRLSTVIDMAKKIASILKEIDQSLKYNQSLPAVVLPQLRQVVNLTDLH